MDIVNDFKARGLIHNTTDLDALRSRLSNGSIGVYVGFDPTADSLHVGHLMGQISLRRFQLAGHRPFALAGGATGMVGDPGGRSQERNLLDVDTLQHNVHCISSQLQRILDFDGVNAAALVNNFDWTANISVLDFLRDVGKHTTVNHMMTKDSVRARLEGEHGISFTEFSYMLLQANDFRHLCEHHNVELQMGGSDQWGNITAGTDLIRRTLGRTVHGLTWPLLLKSDGTKFGKTADGAVWLDPQRTTPFQFRQFWVQIEDNAIASMLAKFSLLSLDEIDNLLDTHFQAPERRSAQSTLANELTELIHGVDAARSAADTANILFGGDPFSASQRSFESLAAEIPTSLRMHHDLDDLLEVLVDIGLASSKNDARRTLSGRGFRVNGILLDQNSKLTQQELLHGRFLLFRKGKTTHHLIEVSS